MKSYADYHNEIGSLFSTFNSSQSAIHRWIVDLAVETCTANDKTRPLNGWRALVDASQPDSNTIGAKAIGLFIKRVGLRVTKDGFVAINAKSKVEVGSREWLDDIKANPWFKEKKNAKEWKEANPNAKQFGMELAKDAYGGNHVTDEDIVKQVRAAMRETVDTESFKTWTEGYNERNPVEEAA